MSTTVATLTEVSRAKLFLRLIGAPTTNNALILAVVAFIRVSGGTAFDVRKAASRLLALAVYTPITTPQPYGGVGDYNTRLKATADSYKLVLSAARNGRGGDFLYALALTSWDANHFGGYVNGTIDTSRNRLFTTYSRFTGLTMPTPPTQPKPVARPIPPKPKVLQPPPNLANDFADPYAAGRFYDARHRESRLETLDTVATGE